MEKTKSHIYIMCCGGFYKFYKIGVSKDPERRAKELNNRPYEVDVIFVSSATEYAYKIEKRLHEWLEEYKVGGEWYDFPKSMVRKIIKQIDLMRSDEGDIFDEVW